jgi:FkbM family methyltransferase
MISYAQNFEDVMLNRAFGGRKTGFYIDVGAADPINSSVTKWLYDIGWSGINIEPLPAFYERLLSDRPRDINLNCGASDTNGKARFYSLPLPEWSTFNRALLPAGVAGTTRMIQVRTLNDIIVENAPDRKIDFLKIDVEGWEDRVMRGIDLRKHRPTVILTEGIDRETKQLISEPVDAILSDAGYIRVYFDGINVFYIKKERSNLKKKFSSPPNLFDNFKLHREVELARNIDVLAGQLKVSEADRAARLKQIETLTDQLKVSETDRAARLKQIEEMGVRLKKSEADRVARLEQIEALTSQLRVSETDHAASLNLLSRREGEVAELGGRHDALLDLLSRREAELAELAERHAASFPRRRTRRADRSP